MGMTLPPAMRKKLGIAAKPSKYHNVAVVVDGVRFDSKREAAFYSKLCAYRDAGEC